MRFKQGDRLHRELIEAALSEYAILAEDHPPVPNQDRLSTIPTTALE